MLSNACVFHAGGIAFRSSRTRDVATRVVPQAVRPPSPVNQSCVDLVGLDLVGLDLAGAASLQPSLPSRPPRTAVRRESPDRGRPASMNACRRSEGWLGGHRSDQPLSGDSL